MTYQDQTNSTATPEIVKPSDLHDPTPNGYSTAVIAPNAGRLAFISGQGGKDQTGGLSPDFGAQVAQAYANLGAVLDAMEEGPENVVKLTVFVVDHDMSKVGVIAQNVMQMFGDRLPA